MAEQISGYSLSRNWFDFCFENPEKVKPSHTALYFFAIEHCNRLGWKKKFGLPATMAMEAIGIKSYNSYKQTLLDLISFGFINMIEVSKNQYSSNIVALSNFDEPNDKALDKAMIKHTSKQSESTVQSTVQSIDSIDKHITYNNKQENSHSDILFSIEHCITVAMNDQRWVDANKVTKKDLEAFNKLLEKRGEYEKNPMDYKKHYANWTAGGKKDDTVLSKEQTQADELKAKMRGHLARVTN